MTNSSIYGRYGLSGNPFRELTSESLESVRILHVPQAIDASLSSMRDEIVERENSNIVFLIGDFGAGKTQRLLLFNEYANGNGTFSTFNHVSNETEYAIKNLCGSIIASAKESSKASFFSQPKWLREIIKIEKKAAKTYDPVRTGEVIADALNGTAPSFLLLNDLQKIKGSDDIDTFFQTMQTTFDSIEPGVLIMFNCDRGFLDSIRGMDPSFVQRINRMVSVPPMNDREAALLIAKRMTRKRIIDQMEPLFPFLEEAVQLMNRKAEGNPREILKMADKVLEEAAGQKKIGIGASFVEGALSDCLF